MVTPSVPACRAPGDPRRGVPLTTLGRWLLTGAVAEVRSPSVNKELDDEVNKTGSGEAREVQDLCACGQVC